MEAPTQTPLQQVMEAPPAYTVRARDDEINLTIPPPSYKQAREMLSVDGRDLESNGPTYRAPVRGSTPWLFAILGAASRTDSVVSRPNIEALQQPVVQLEETRDQAANTDPSALASRQPRHPKTKLCIAWAILILIIALPPIVIKASTPHDLATSGTAPPAQAEVPGSVLQGN